MTETFEAVLDDPDLSLEDQVETFRRLTRDNEQKKRHAGRRLYARLRRSGNKPLLRRFLLAFNAYDTEYEYIRFTGDRARHAASFRVAMTTRTRRMKKLGRHTCPEWLVWDKPEGARFAEALGIAVPRQLTVSPLAGLDFAPGTVIKPLAANHGDGVYLIFSKDRIGDAVRGDFFSGYDRLAARLQDDLASGRIRQDQWIVEELARNARDPAGCAPDWKFYCFYGEVVMITHSRRFPEMQDVWFGPDGHETDLGFSTGRQKLPVPKTPEPLLTAAQTISLAVPAPFLRIDLLEADTGPMVGEFTARPFFWRRFGRKLDLELGDAFIAAEARLQADLMAGKDFATWKAFAADSPHRPEAP